MERALQRISRQDVVSKCVREVKLVTDEQEKALAKKELRIDSDNGETMVDNVFGV